MISTRISFVIMAAVALLLFHLSTLGYAEYETAKFLFVKVFSLVVVAVSYQGYALTFKSRP